MGNVVEVYCLKRREPTGIPEPTNKYYAAYQLMLYFCKKASKAEPVNSFIGVETGLLPCYVFGFIGVFILLMILGYNRGINNERCN